MTDATRTGAAPAAAWPQRLYAALLADVDGAWLYAFRVLFGLAMCASSLRFVAFGWVDAFFVKPAFHFKYWGFHWVEPLPGPAMHALVWALAGLSLLVALGLWFRFAAWAFAIGFAYLQLIDVATYLNHYYLANLLAILLALSPAGQAYSLDALRARNARAARTPAFWLYLFRFQIGVVYTFAGLAKAQADWLIHAQPLRIWLASKTGLPVLGALFTADWAAPVLSWGGFLFDSGIVWLLLWRRTRPFAYAAVIGFHAMTSALFPIGMFPVIMVLSALVFFEPDWPRRVLAFLGRTQQFHVPLPVPLPVPARPTPKHALIFACTLVYCALHVALPLRHVVYPGSVLWHEQGMRWSWRVMVREKNGSVTFLVRDKRSGREWQVNPRRYLTRQQEQELSGQPDLILQLAHHVREEFMRRVGGPVEVRVDALVSLNGRRARALIDPSVDLGAVLDGVAPATWITAAPSEPPPHIHPI